MPGPPPKPAAQRRRSSSTATVRLPAEGPSKVPSLPGERKLLASTREWWRTVWRSPMATIYLPADVPALVRLARLIDLECRGDGDGVTRQEIRQLEDRFGLSPLARRRLQWEVDQAAGAGTPPPSKAGSEGRGRKGRVLTLAVDNAAS